MNSPQQILFDTYSQLLADCPEKWVKAAGDVCFMFLDNGLSMCYYLDRDNGKCISLYTIDKTGEIKNELIIRENETREVFAKFIEIYNKIKEQATTNKFSALQKNVGNPVHCPA